MSPRGPGHARLAVLLLASAIGAGPARAERRLTLAEAVELALAAEPMVAEARIAGDRSELAVLRAQLDRITVTVDGTLRELWNKTNIAGPTAYNCSLAIGTFQTDPANCRSLGGTSTPARSDQQSPEFWQGLSNLKAQVAVPLFSGFRVSSNVALRQRQQEGSLAQLRQARRDTALSVARAYWAVRRVDLAVEVVAAALARLRESEAVVTARLGAGLAPPIDRNRAVLSRQQQEALVADLHGQAGELSTTLAVLLGLNEDLVLVDPAEVPPGGPPAVEDLVREAARHRPELARAEAAYQAQEQVVRIARADYFPQLSAVGLFQYGNNQFNTGSGAFSVSDAADPFKSVSGSLSAGLTLTVNLFNTLNTYTSVKDARYELARLGEELRLARRAVESDVRVARAKLVHLYGQLAPLQQAVAVARDNVTILDARYQNGEALVIELLQAQVDLTSVERQLADLSAQIRLAWLELDAALGTTVGLSS